MYNREKFIIRAIKSCLVQDFVNFEIIVIDDGSTDKSLDIVKNIKDKRIKVIKNESNCERLIARNRGAKISTGDWLIWFDSDDELMPNALSTIRHQIEHLPSDVLGLRFMCQLDSGFISPSPPHEDEILDYIGYIKWVESHNGKWSETMPVVHKKTVKSVLFPEDYAYTGEMQYHLDFTFKYKVKACKEVVRTYHLDAENNTWNPDLSKMLKISSTYAARQEVILNNHGLSLKNFAPKTYSALISGMLTQLLFSGQRKKSFKMLLKAISYGLLNRRIMVIFCLGMLNPNLLAHAKITYSKRFVRLH